MAYRGPQFPVTRPLRKSVVRGDLIIEDHRHDETIAALKAATEAAQQSLRDRYMAKVANVKSDPDLTPAGKEKKLRGLMRELENDLADHVKAISAAEGHAAKLRATLTAPPPEPRDETPYQGTSRAMREHRAVMDFKALDPSQRREAQRKARLAGQHEFLSALVREPGLLSGEDAEAITIELARARDPWGMTQLEELLGKVNPNRGAHDPESSALLVTKFCVDNLREFVKKETGVEAAAADVLAAAGVQISDGPAIMLSPEQAHNVTLFRAAKEVAQAANKTVTVSGSEGSSDLDVGHDDNGGGGSGGLTA